MFMPISCAASLSSDTASIARPLFVLFMKSERPITISIETTIATIASPVMTTCPSKSDILGTFTTEVKLTGFSPNRSSAEF